MAEFESDRRDFPRLRRSIAVRYKFLSSTVKDEAMDRVCEGSTQDLSIGGMLLVGPVPRMDWLKDLLLGRIDIGVNLQIPGVEFPVKALTRVAWLESVDEEALCLRIGLRVLEMPPDQRRLLSDYLMKETAVP